MLKTRPFSVTIVDCHFSYHPRCQSGDVSNCCPHDTLQSLLKNSTLALLPAPENSQDYTNDELNVLTRAPAEFLKSVMALSSPSSSGTVFWEVVDDHVLHLRLLYPLDVVVGTRVRGNLWIPLVNAWGGDGANDVESVRVCLRALTVLDDLAYGADWNASMCGSHKIYMKSAPVPENIGLSPQQLNTVGFMLRREHGDYNCVSCGKTSDVCLNMATFHLSVTPPVETIRGGFVCDPPGSGKTIAALSLAMVSPGDAPTLLICPAPLVEQWSRVAREQAAYLHAWTYRPLLPDNVCRDALDLLRCKISVSNIRLVIASYDDVRKDPLFQAMVWSRVIFDESQLISVTDTHLTPRYIRAPRRWCLTSAPFRVDIDPQLQALGYLVWDPSTIVALMQVASMRTEPLMIPPKTLKIFDCMLPLLLPCENDIVDDCPVCLCSPVNPVKTQCGHRFCSECLVSSLQYKETCPVCRAPLGRLPDHEKHAKCLAIYHLIRNQEMRFPKFKAIIVSQDVTLLKLMKVYFGDVRGSSCSLVSKKDSVGVTDFVRGKARILMVDESISHLGLKFGEVSHIFFLDRVSESKQLGIINMVSNEHVIAVTLSFHVLEKQCSLQ